MLRIQSEIHARPSQWAPKGAFDSGSEALAGSADISAIRFVIGSLAQPRSQRALIYPQMTGIGIQPHTEPPGPEGPNASFTMASVECAIGPWVSSPIEIPPAAHFASLLCTARLSGGALNEQERADLPDSMLVHTVDGSLLMRSAGVIHILRRLGSIWSLWAALLWIVPKPIRDVGYDLFARYRKRWFSPRPGSVRSCPRSSGPASTFEARAFRIKIRP